MIKNMPAAAGAKTGFLLKYIARDIGVAVVPGSSFYMGEDKGTSRVRY